MKDIVLFSTTAALIGVYLLHYHWHWFGGACSQETSSTGTDRTTKDSKNEPPPVEKARDLHTNNDDGETASTTSTTPSSSADDGANEAARRLAQQRRPDTSDYRYLLVHEVPLMDVRAPGEFSKGAFPTAVSLPIMNNEERHLVGLCYAQEGKASAIALGHKLVSGQVKAERMEGWAQFARDNHGGYLYCFRGGLRSHTIQTWIWHETGIYLPLVTGGYKALRNFLMRELEVSLRVPCSSSCQDDDNDNVADGPTTAATSSTIDASTSTPIHLVRVCGPTGSSKTKLLHALPDTSIDLEGLAHHRGSSFGHFPDPQPSQVDFENRLSLRLLRLRHNFNATTATGTTTTDTKNDNTTTRDDARSFMTLFVEDEGNKIGNLFTPPLLAHRMANCAGLVIIDETLEDRVAAILQDYIVDLGERYAQHYDNNDDDANNVSAITAAGGKSGATSVGVEMHRAHLLGALTKCQKRMSKKAYHEIRELLTTGLDQYYDHTNTDQREIGILQEWIQRMLLEYYDPLYTHTHKQQQNAPVLFRGNLAAAIAFCKAY